MVTWIGRKGPGWCVGPDNISVLYKIIRQKPLKNLLLSGRKCSKMGFLRYISMGDVSISMMKGSAKE